MARVAIIGGFLGAGKTSTILKLSHILQDRGKRVAVIMNDQGQELVDTELARLTDVPVGEVTGGCFCCRFEDLYDTMTRLLEEMKPDVLFAEAVGSCTDVKATVVRPLQEKYPGLVELAPLTIFLDPARYQELVGEGARRGGDPDQDLLAYLFHKQLEEAQVIALNKVDLLSDEAVEELGFSLSLRYPRAQVRAVSALTGTGLDDLLDLLGSTTADGRTISEIDYDRYAQAEARLAWLNASGVCRSLDFGGFSPKAWIERLATGLKERFRAESCIIGHVKLQLVTPSGHTTASLTRTSEEGIDFRSEQAAPVGEANLLINARVELEVPRLEEIARTTLEATNQAMSTETQVQAWQCFSPSRPRPTYRLAEAAGVGFETSNPAED
jgi:G3E family GTPase